MNERAEKLRAALLQEYFRAKLELSEAQKPSLRYSKLESHVEVMAAVLRKDSDLEAEETRAHRAAQARDTLDEAPMARESES